MEGWGEKVIKIRSSFLGKWLWLCGDEENHLWRHVIGMKYWEAYGHWTFDLVRRPWDLVDVVCSEVLRQVGLLGLIRDGGSVRFWHYVWCGNTMFLIATNKKCVYILFMDWSENGRSCLWNPTFIHAFQDWELGSSVLPFQPRICQGAVGMVDYIGN